MDRRSSAGGTVRAGFESLQGGGVRTSAELTRSGPTSEDPSLMVDRPVAEIRASYVSTRSRIKGDDCRVAP